MNTMKPVRSDTARTRKSLLAAAIEVFAAKGYRDTTIGDICIRARTNVASVNYHFGDKETLYVEAWRRAFSESMKTHPPDGGVSPDASPEDRLRGQISALMHRIADESNKEFLIVMKELSTPTGLLEEVMREELHPLQKRMEGVVRELLGPHASDLEVRLCEASIISQCLGPMRGQRERRKADGLPPRFDVETFSDHVFKFSLAGIRAIRKDVEKRQRGLKK